MTITHGAWDLTVQGLPGPGLPLLIRLGTPPPSLPRHQTWDPSQVISGGHHWRLVHLGDYRPPSPSNIWQWPIKDMVCKEAGHILLEWFLVIPLLPANKVAKVMFSIVSICQFFCPQGGGRHTGPESGRLAFN